MQTRVCVDKRQILALLGREGFCRATHAGHPIQLFVCASNDEEAQMNVCYRVELSQAERGALTARDISRHSSDSSREVGQGNLGEVQPLQPAHPPLLGPRVRVGVGKAIVVEQRADVLRRTIRRRIGGHQGENGAGLLVTGGKSVPIALPKYQLSLVVIMIMPRTNFKSIDEYIAAQPDLLQDVLRRVRKTIQSALPDAEETISYQIPTYKLHGRAVIYFAGWKQHYSLYPASDRLVATFKNELAEYRITKGTIRFPLDDQVPVKLIGRVAKFRANEQLEHTRANAAQKERKLGL